MADIRLYQNAALSSPADADLVFTANSGSTPAYIESKTTMAQLATYVQSKLGPSGVTVQTVFISPLGNDTTGNGALSAPFQTRAKALTYIGISATSSNPYVILYDSGSYTPSTFVVYPNIYDFALSPGSVNITVGSSSITQASSWASTTADYYMSGLTFDSATALNLNFSSLSSVFANLYFNSNNFTAACSINGFNNTVSPFFENNNFLGGITITSPHTVNGTNGNNFASIDIESGSPSAAEIKPTFIGNQSLGSVTLHTQNGADISAVIKSSPVNSYTLHAENKSTIECSSDSISWQSPTIIGNAAFTLSTQLQSINGLSSLSNAVLVTDGSNNPGLSTTLPSGLTVGNTGAFQTINDIQLDDGFGGTVVNRLNAVNELLAQQALSCGSSVYSTGTISQSGTTITGSGTAFTSAMVGGLLKWTSGGLVGTYALITVVTNGTTITVDNSFTQAGPQTFEIFYNGFSSLNGVHIGIGSGCTIYGQPTWNNSQTFPSLSLNGNITSTTTTTGVLPQISTKVARTGTTAVVSGDRLGQWNYEGYDGAAYQNSAQIFASVDGTVSSGVVPARLDFYLANSSGVLTDYFKIRANGTVATANNTLDDGSGNFTASGALKGSNYTQTAGILTIGDNSTTNIVGTSTTGGQYLGSTTKPFGFIFLGAASNYVPINVTTQTNNGVQLNIPDMGDTNPKNMVVTNTQNVTTTSVTMAKWGAYFMNNASQVTGTFPSTIAQGNIFYVYGVGNGGWVVNIPVGVTFYKSSTQSGTATLTSSDSLDAVMLVAISSTKVSVIVLKGNPALV